jgi:amidase
LVRHVRAQADLRPGAVHRRLSHRANAGHVGPIARSAADAALLLEAVAGTDGLDPRQTVGLPPTRYTHALTGDVRGLRIGGVAEGFGWRTLSEADVDEAVRDAAHAFERLGCTVTDVSVPWHRDGPHVWNAIALEGATALMVAGNSMGTNWKATTPVLRASWPGSLTPSTPRVSEVLT